VGFLNCHPSTFFTNPEHARVSAVLKGDPVMLRLNRDMVIFFKVIASGLTAGLLIFFISALSGEDLLKNHSSIKDLGNLLQDISSELNGNIDRRIRQLGEVPKKNPYRKFYAAELAKEIHEVSYLTEKQKIMFDAYNVRDFETKSKRLVSFSETADIDGLVNELDIVKRELKNSANLVDKRQEKLDRQRNAYLFLFFILWVAIYFYYGRGFIRER
jgi:hypothetical protein